MQISKIIKRHFSTPAGATLSSSFKAKANYKEFIKQVHPDVIFTAPEKVKEENLRSIKRLNTYIENLKKNAGVDDLLLKFYTPEKSTVKAKKFYYFEVKLGKFVPNAPQPLRDSHINSSYDRL
jgi:hypothetical protein